GRLKDAIIVRGSNHYPQDIEATAQSASTALSVDKGAAFSVAVNNEELLVVQEVTRSALRSIEAAPVVAQVRRRIADEHGLRAHRVLLLQPRHSPRTSL